MAMFIEASQPRQKAPSGPVIVTAVFVPLKLIEPLFWIRYAQLAGAKSPVKPTVGSGVTSEIEYWYVPGPSMIPPLDGLPSATSISKSASVRQPKLPVRMLEAFSSNWQLPFSVALIWLRHDRLSTGRGACVTVMKKSSWRTLPAASTAVITI